MPMLFGDPSDFAIEAGVEPDLKPPSHVWGHMRVWCRAFALGDIDDRHCCLALACDRLAWLAAHIDELWTPELDAFDNIGRWNFLKTILYSHQGDTYLGEHDRRTLAEMRLDAVEYHRFDFLTNWGEQFDRSGAGSFLFRPPGGDVHILSREFPLHLGLCARVTAAGFVAAVNCFTEWFHEQECRLQTGE